MFVVTAKEMLYSLAAELCPPRKIEAAKVNPDWCSVYTFKISSILTLHPEMLAHVIPAPRKKKGKLVLQ